MKIIAIIVSIIIVLFLLVILSAVRISGLITQEEEKHKDK